MKNLANLVKVHVTAGTVNASQRREPLAFVLLLLFLHAVVVYISKDVDVNVTSCSCLRLRSVLVGGALAMGLGGHRRIRDPRGRRKVARDRERCWPASMACHPSSRRMSAAGFHPTLLSDKTSEWIKTKQKKSRSHLLFVSFGGVAADKASLSSHKKPSVFSVFQSPLSKDSIKGRRLVKVEPRGTMSWGCTFDLLVSKLSNALALNKPLCASSFPFQTFLSKY